MELDFQVYHAEHLLFFLATITIILLSFCMVSLDVDVLMWIMFHFLPSKTITQEYASLVSINKIT
jgi:hypothetical protein